MNKTNIYIMFSFICILVFSVLVLIYPTFWREFFESSLDIITNSFGWIYILLFFVALIFFIWIVVSKYGDIKLGDCNDVPQYNNFEWASMILCTGMAGSIMIFSFVDPIYYLSDPPFGIEAMSIKAYEYAHMYSQYHWGILFWPLCIPIALIMGINMYILKRNSDSLGSVLGDNGSCRKIGTIVDVISVISIFGGMGTSMGLSAPLISELLRDVSGLQTDYMLLFVFILWFVVFFISVIKGLNKGIKRLSVINIIVAFSFVFYVLVHTNVIKVIELEMNSLGIYLNNAFRMALYTDPFDTNRFPQRWSVYYLAFTLVYVVLTGVFTARISKGRTLRQVALGMFGYGILGVIVSFSICGYYSINLQRNNIINLVDILEQLGKDQLIISILNTFPHSIFLKILFAIVCFLFMATTMDSTVYVLSMLTSRGRSTEEPSKPNRILWAISIFFFSLAISRIGGLETMQIVSIVSAFPMNFVLCIVMYYVYKSLRKM